MRWSLGRISESDFDRQVSCFYGRSTAGLDLDDRIIRRETGDAESIEADD
jgi:hypothetical protein